MIAGEKKFVLIKKHHVATRVTGNRNRDQVLINFKWIVAAHYCLDAVPAGAVIRMHDSFAVESFSEPIVIGDIVLVRQQHLAGAAH